MITFKDQLALAVYFTLFGIFLSVTYDILHFYLKRWKAKAAVGYVIQALYWLGMTLTACLFAYRVSDGAVSIYTFLFFFIGVLVYRGLLRLGLHKDLDRFTRVFARTYGFLKKWLRELLFAPEMTSLLARARQAVKHKLTKQKPKEEQESQ
jgi:hypothetical protein